MGMKYRLAQTPMKIGSVEIPNRAVRTAHATLFSRGEVNDTHIQYHMERALGGVGLTILEGVSVHPSSTFSLTLTDEKGIAPLRKLVSALEPTGMKLFQQLWHGGSNEGASNGGPSWSVTDLPGRYSKFPPIAMSSLQIRELIDSYAKAANRLVAAGIHGAEVLAGNGYLISQFLSPSLNTRTDCYGGSFDNRVRFLEELLSEIKFRVPNTFALGVRIGCSSDEKILSTSDVNAAILRLQGLGLIDFVNLSHGDYYYHVERYAAMDRPVGYQIEPSRIVSEGVTVPRIVVGRFGSMDDVEHTLRAGDAEFVNLVRATIADPDLVQKEIDGRSAEVRPCIGCNQGCIGGLFSGRMSCTVNPAVGYESTLSERLIKRAEKPKSVLIVGGGASGMEAARVAALAGHNVTLFEASPNLGGQVNLAKILPKNHGIGDIALWLERELFRLGVHIRLSTYVDADEVLALMPDVVIIATGSIGTELKDWRQVATPHVELDIDQDAQVIMSEDLITNRYLPPGKKAVVFDDVGHYEGIGCCEILLESGFHVTYVTRHWSFAPEIDKTGRAQAALRRFYSKGNFSITNNSLITSISPDSVNVRPIDGVSTTSLPSDVTVLVTYRSSFRELYEELKNSIPTVYAVGDAVSPRDLVSAMREGHLSSRSIDDTEFEVMWKNI